MQHTTRAGMTERKGRTDGRQARAQARRKQQHQCTFLWISLCLSINYTTLPRMVDGVGMNGLEESCVPGVAFFKAARKKKKKKWAKKKSNCGAHFLCLSSGRRSASAPRLHGEGCVCDCFLACWLATAWVMRAALRCAVALGAAPLPPRSQPQATGDLAACGGAAALRCHAHGRPPPLLTRADADDDSLQRVRGHRKRVARS